MCRCEGILGRSCTWEMGRGQRDCYWSTTIRRRIQCRTATVREDGGDGVREDARRDGETGHWIRADPARFAVLSLRRLYYFWFGVVPHPGGRGFVNQYGRNLNFQFTSLVGLLGLALALRRHVPGACCSLGVCAAAANVLLCDGARAVSASAGAVDHDWRVPVSVIGEELAGERVPSNFRNRGPKGTTQASKRRPIGARRCDRRRRAWRRVCRCGMCRHQQDRLRSRWGCLSHGSARGHKPRRDRRGR